MKLYRGYKTTPRTFVPSLEDELAALDRKAAKIDTANIFEYMSQMGREAVLRREELHKIAGPQLFTDDKAVARDFAGENGYVIVMDIPNDVAEEHYAGEQRMMQGDTLRYSSNYKFTGKELAQRPEDWKLDLISIDEERSREKERTGTRLPLGDTINKTLYGKEELRPQDAQALRDYNASRESRDKGRSPGGEGGSRL